MSGKSDFIVKSLPCRPLALVCLVRRVSAVTSKLETQENWRTINGVKQFT